MAKPAVEFVAQGKKLLLVYRPRDDTAWIHDDYFANGRSLDIKGTYCLTQADLARPPSRGATGELNDDDLFEVSFVVATAEGGYYVFKPEVLDVDVPVLVATDVTPTWKWFSAEKRVSVVALLAGLKPSRIVIGGDAPDAIPVAEYERMVAQFPTAHELSGYVRSRLSVVFRELSDARVDAEALLQSYVDRRVTAKSQDLMQPFREFEVSKYEFLHRKLTAMLADPEGPSERQWQEQIRDIVRLLHPKYIAAFPSVQIPDSVTGGRRQLDFLLVDVDGHVDVIEIKKPFNARIVTEATYRGNHVPHRELAGTVTQVEKYLFHLKRSGAAGEDSLTRRFSQELPPGLAIRIVNPCGLIIMGRDDDLTPQQREDFEVFRRQNRNIVDVITYDDLLRRLERLLGQLKAGH